MAWLHATPEGTKKTRYAALKVLNENHPAFEMPDIETEHAAGYLIAMLQEAGLMSSNGMGPVPLSWQEIDSWIRVSGRVLPMWERLMVKTLSEDYVSELMQATARDRAQPYTAVPEQEEEQIDRPAVADKILSILSKFKKQTKTVEESLNEEGT